MKGLGKITYDPESDALYIYLVSNPTVAKTKNFTNDIVLDFDPQNKLVGIEVLDVSAGFDLSSVISQYNLDPRIDEILSHVKSLLPAVEEQLVLA